MLKKNASAKIAAAMIHKTDGSLITTGSVTAKVSKDGAAPAASTNSVSHLGDGLWGLTLTAGEMNADVVCVLLTHTDAVPRELSLYTDSKLVSDLQDFDPDNDAVATVTAVGQVNALAAAAAQDVWDVAASTADNTAGGIGALVVQKLGYITSETSLDTNGLISGDLITIYRGESKILYLEVDPASIDLSGYTPKLAVSLNVTGESGDLSFGEWTGTVENGGATGQRVKFTLASADTAEFALDEGVVNPYRINVGRAYRYTISAYNGSGTPPCPTLASGYLSVEDRFTTCQGAAASKTYVS